MPIALDSKRPRPRIANSCLATSKRHARLAALLVFGAELVPAVELAPIAIEAERLALPTKQAAETVYTGTAVTATGIEYQGNKATMRVYGALGWLPGVSAESPDASGLAVEQTSVRVRGVRGLLGTLTVAGVPNYGGNPIGPRDYLYDLENFSSISLYKGAVPADLGTGVGTRGGAIVLHPRWPDETASARLDQRFGSYAFTRTYARLESGRLHASGTRLAGAFSYAEAEKWRGPGTLGPRRNAHLTLVQPLGTALELKLWLNHNDQEQHLYRALTYDQIAGPHAHPRRDFTARRSGQPEVDVNYYDYNRGSYLNTDLLAVLTYAPTETSRFVLKPYYSTEDSTIFQGASGGRVQQRQRDIDRWGVIAEGQKTWAGVNALLGYHYEQSAMDIGTRNYAIVPTGLSYRGQGVTATTGTTYIHSPYAKLAGHTGALHWQVGIKYFRFEDAASAGYITGGPPNYPLLRAPDLDRQARTHDMWLPTVGVSYDLTPAAQLHASYGRNFIRPYAYLPLVTVYQSHRAAFRAAGVTLDQLFAGYGMEQSDTLDFGLRYRGEWLEPTVTLFYGRYRDLLTSVADPRVRVDGKPLNYQQNIGEATGYGVELALDAYLSTAVSGFLHATYTRMTYDQDLTYQNMVMNTKGKQVVDTPRWMAQAGLRYRWGEVEVRPSVRYLGRRHGDAVHREAIDAAVIADLTLSYRNTRWWPGTPLTATLELSNLFSADYVAVINAADDNRAGSPSYYPGAPFTALLTLGVAF